MVVALVVELLYAGMVTGLVYGMEEDLEQMSPVVIHAHTTRDVLEGTINRKLIELVAEMMGGEAIRKAV